MIKKVGSQYVVYNEYGKIMGTYKTLAEARKRMNMNSYFNKKTSLTIKDSNKDKG